MSEVIATLSDTDVATVLNVPLCVQLKHRPWSIDYRRRILDHFMRYSHFANWKMLSSHLHREEHHVAELAARRFISGIRGNHTYKQPNRLCIATFIYICTIDSIIRLCIYRPFHDGRVKEF